MYIEVPPLGVYKISHSNSQQVVSLFPWQNLCIHSVYSNQLNEFETHLGNSIIVHQSIDPHWLHVQENTIMPKYNFQLIFQSEDFIKYLSNISSKSELFEKLLSITDIQCTCNILVNFLCASVRERIAATPNYCKNCIQLKSLTCDHTKIGILFSGGIDCTIIAALADRHVNKMDSIDLINVSFEKVKRQSQQKSMINVIETYNTPDRISAIDSLKELQVLCPNRYFKMV